MRGEVIGEWEKGVEGPQISSARQCMTQIIASFRARVRTETKLEDCCAVVGMNMKHKRSDNIAALENSDLRVAMVSS